jgi:hypothetical protein
MQKVIGLPFQFSLHSLTEIILSNEFVIVACLPSFSMKQIVGEFSLELETFLYIFTLFNEHVFRWAVKIGTILFHKITFTNDFSLLELPNQQRPILSINFGKTIRPVILGEFRITLSTGPS